MEEVRTAARAMADKGDVQICQRGEVVDPQSFQGPIRLRLVVGTGDRGPEI